jgi:hypothetical protein
MNDVREWLDSPDSDEWRRENFARLKPALVTIKDELDDSLMDCDIVGILWHA